MRRRLEVFIPIVLLSILVQLIAPISAFRAVAYASADPLFDGVDLFGNGFKPGRHADRPSQVRSMIAAIAVPFAQLVMAAPMRSIRRHSVFVVLQRQYQRDVMAASRRPDAGPSGRLERPGARASLHFLTTTYSR